MHEYSLVGHPREKIIFILAFISISLAPLISKVVQASFQNYFNIVISLTLSSSTIFTLLYILFNKFIWKTSVFRNVYSFPDLNGEWECAGKSLNVELNEEFDWSGIVVIKQSWDKVLITLKTSNSTSQSVSIIGGIKHLPGMGYKLSYNYENNPNALAKDLKKHEGFCSLIFNEDLALAQGFYFNNVKERKTYGEMNLTGRSI